MCHTSLRGCWLWSRTTSACVWGLLYLLIWTCSECSECSRVQGSSAARGEKHPRPKQGGVMFVPGFQAFPSWSMLCRYEFIRSNQCCEQGMSHALTKVVKIKIFKEKLNKAKGNHAFPHNYKCTRNWARLQIMLFLPVFPTSFWGDGIIFMLDQFFILILLLPKSSCTSVTQGFFRGERKVVLPHERQAKPCSQWSTDPSSLTQLQRVPAAIHPHQKASSLGSLTLPRHTVFSVLVMCWWAKMTSF